MGSDELTPRPPLSRECLAGEGKDVVGDRGKVGGDVLEREDVT